jgi:large subunit ribosomal protein L21
MAETYAIVESGGKQYRAEKGVTLVVDRLSADEGAKVNLRAVMYRGERDVVLETGELEKVKVEAVVAGHERGAKVKVFKHRPKKGYRRRAGHRSELTRLEVTDVKLLARKPAAKAAAKPETADSGQQTAEKPKAAPKKPATAKKPAAAKKPATKRKTTATRKTTTRKPTAKKTEK